MKLIYGLVLVAAAVFGGCGFVGDDVCAGIWKDTDAGKVCVPTDSASAPATNAGNDDSVKSATADKTDEDKKDASEGNDDDADEPRRIECYYNSDCGFNEICDEDGRCVTVSPTDDDDAAPVDDDALPIEDDDAASDDDNADDDVAPADDDVVADDDATPPSDDDDETCLPTGDEVCNGLDDNCSGMKDEGDLCTLGRSCKSGACACPTDTVLCDACTNTKTDRNNCGGCGVKCDADEACTEGKCISPDDPEPEPEPEPTPTCTPQAEICDGKDNDCDGKTDEGDDGLALFRSCGYDNTTPKGECKRGKQDCEGGQWGACDDLVNPTPEVCGDEKDNDCDGTIDNGVKNACGGCGSAPSESCGADGKGNDIDDNCDGVKDENCICTPGGQPQACGTELAGHGQCKAGTRACLPGGVWGPCENGFVGPEDEVCDGVDNNCDDEPDNGFNVGDACSSGMGECMVNGTFACKTDKSGTECSAQPKVQQDEVCDGLDNDCDGTKDDGQLCTDGQSCLSGTCLCPADMTLCGANCRDIKTDEANCGGCGIACASGEICNVGSCGTPLPPDECEDSEEGVGVVDYTSVTVGRIIVRADQTELCKSSTITNELKNCQFSLLEYPEFTSTFQIDTDFGDDGMKGWGTGDRWYANNRSNNPFDGTFDLKVCVNRKWKKVAPPQLLTDGGAANASYGGVSYDKLPFVE